MFRRSGRRVLPFLAAAVALALGPVALLDVIVLGEAWYDVFPQALVALLAAGGVYAQPGRRTGPPLRLTPDHLVPSEIQVPLTGPVPSPRRVRPELAGRWGGSSLPDGPAGQKPSADGL